MLWDHYVFRRGNDVFELWDKLFEGRPLRFLYIAGRGFDVRAQYVMKKFMESLADDQKEIEEAKLVLVGFSDYELQKEIQELTEENALALEEMFSVIGETENINIGSSTLADGETSASTALRVGIEEVFKRVTDQTDIIIDVSSLPRVAYLSLLMGLLHKLVPKKDIDQDIHPLVAGKVNLQVLVAEDAALDGQIRAEDPSNDLIVIPGFSGALYVESVQDWPLVWFPILGENRVNQLQKVMDSATIPTSAEICPVLPHPSCDPRRADKLLVEYKGPLFDSRQTPITNILYAHESHPFEAYRQLLRAMIRYKNSMMVLGGCRLVVTPLASKLITIGAGLACFEMKPIDLDEYGVAIPYAEPRRYVAPVEILRESSPTISALLLTGDAYSH